MIISPAIVIKNGQCVVFAKGNSNLIKKIDGDPISTAFKFQEQGAQWINILCLDGVKKDDRENREIIRKLVKETNLKIQLDHDIGCPESIRYYIENGISRVILGPTAITNLRIIRDSVEEYGDKIAIKIEGKNNLGFTDGWLTDINIDYIKLAKVMEALGVSYIMYTNNLFYPKLKCSNLQQLSKLNRSVSCNIISRAGFYTKDDIIALQEIGLNDVICWKDYKGNNN